MITVGVEIKIHSEVYDAEMDNGEKIEILGFFIPGHEGVSVAVFIPNNLPDKQTYIEALQQDMIAMLQNFAQITIDKMSAAIDRGMKEDLRIKPIIN